jgi:hypothetical protein
MVAKEEEAGRVSGLAEVDHHHAVLKFLSWRKAGADPEAIAAWIEEGRGLEGLWRICRRPRVSCTAAGGGGLERGGALAGHCAPVMTGTNCHLLLPYCVSTELGMEEEQ